MYMKEMIDYHCHLLPALDDGATDLDESLKMARILYDFGFSTVYCTPHLISGCYENDPPRVGRTTQILQSLLNEAGILLKLMPGCEHYLDESLPGRLSGAFTIGTGKRVLVEVPFRSGPELLRPMVDAFARLGLRPLIAHPERCRAFEPAVAEHGLRGALSVMLGRQPAGDFEQWEVAEMLRRGCLFQGNLGSFAGFYGAEVRERALLFLRHGVYACIGSDAHSSANLQRMLDSGFAAIASEVGTDAAWGLFKAVL